MLVVIEGLDGAGKSTQVKMAKEYIQSNGVNLKYLHFPRYEGSIYGDLIARFLRGEFGTIDTVHPQLVALLFAEDRHDAATIIRKWINEGYTVLLDRYVYSNIAYQCSKLNNFDEAQKLRNWIFDTEYGLFGIPKPDINLFLDVPLSFVDKMLKENREGNERDYLNGKADPPSGITVLGGKTGTTDAAGHCLILLSRDTQNKPYISVIMRADARENLYTSMTDLLSQIGN